MGPYERPDPSDVPGYGRPGGVDDPVPDAEYGDGPEALHPDEPEGGLSPLDPGERVDLDGGDGFSRSESGNVYKLRASMVRTIPLRRRDVAAMAELAGFEVTDRE